MVLVKLGAVDFPRLCPSCGAAGDRRLRCEKCIYFSDEESPETHTVLAYEPWFCAACAGRHELERWKPGPLDYAKRLFGGSGEALGGVIVLGVGLFFLREALEKLSLVLLAFSALPLGTGSWLLRNNWLRNAPCFVKGPTSVTGKVDFTGDQSAEFEPAWARFEFAHPAYAQAFREINRAHLWDPSSGEAVAARQRRAWAEKKRSWYLRIALAALVLFGLASWWFGWGD